jgi:hypothetical protein
MTTTRQDRNAVVLQLIAAARRVEQDGQYPTRTLITGLPKEVTRQETIAAALWVARWIAGRAGLNDVNDDDPCHSARTLNEFRSGVTYNLSRDPEVEQNRAVMLKILALVAATLPTVLPPVESINELLTTAAVNEGPQGFNVTLLRIVELIKALSDLDRFPGRLLDVLAADFITAQEKGNTHE